MVGQADRLKSDEIYAALNKDQEQHCSDKKEGVLQSEKSAHNTKMKE